MTKVLEKLRLEHQSVAFLYIPKVNYYHFKTAEACLYTNTGGVTRVDFMIHAIMFILDVLYFLQMVLKS